MSRRKAGRYLRAAWTLVWTFLGVTAVALQVTAIWTDRRYLDMELLLSKHPVGKVAA